ncbi:MAG: hypothetical protein JXN60_01935 [Lentisphaerae bacterium]|nr:hypothetical protein [Lentisphaerota bacterium]
MKTVRQNMAIAVVMIGMTCVCALAQDSFQEFSLSAHWLSPSRDTDWSSASGVEAQVQFWHTRNTGMALAMGAETWNATDDVYEETGPSSYTYSAVGGDASVTLLGVSALHRAELMEGLNILMDAGIRWAFISSNIRSDAVYEDAAGSTYVSDTIEIEDTVLAVVGVHLEGNLNENVSIRTGLSYRIDLSKPEETFIGESIGETSFQAVSFSVGVACAF